MHIKLKGNKSSSQYILHILTMIFFYFNHVSLHGIIDKLYITIIYKHTPLACKSHLMIINISKLNPSS